MAFLTGPQIGQTYGRHTYHRDTPSVKMRQPDRPLAASSLPNTAATTTSSSSRRGDNGQELPEEGQGARDYRHSSAAEPSSSSPAPQDSSISRWSRGESSSAPRRLSAAAMVESGGAAAFLPESVVEAVAVEAAAAAARAHGAMAASRTLACIFQVCSVWRSVSQSELLWENAFNVVWPTQARQPERSWRREFQRAHATASNFRRGRARHTILVEEETGGRHYEPPRSLAISNDYLVGGHFDGALRIFDLKTKACVWTLRANQEEGFGPLSRAIAGISLQGDDIVFGSVDGNVFTASASRGNRVRVHVGRVIQDGALISFAASQRWWIALYAGSVGHCFRLWDAATKQVVYRGGNMTDDDAMRGWHMLVERAGRVGRVRIVNEELLVAANRRRIRVHDLGTHGMPLIVERDQEAENNAVEAMDVRGNKLLSASYEGLARIRELPTMVEVLTVRHPGVHANPRLRPDDRDQMQQLFGTLNSRQLFLCFSGAVNAWDCSSGEHLYSLREETGYMYNDMVASDSCLALGAVRSERPLFDSEDHLQKARIAHINIWFVIGETGERGWRTKEEIRLCIAVIEKGREVFLSRGVNLLLPDTLVSSNSTSPALTPFVFLGRLVLFSNRRFRSSRYVCAANTNGNVVMRIRASQLHVNAKKRHMLQLAALVTASLVNGSNAGKANRMCSMPSCLADHMLGFSHSCPTVGWELFQFPQSVSIVSAAHRERLFFLGVYRQNRSDLTGRTKEILATTTCMNDFSSAEWSTLWSSKSATASIQANTKVNLNAFIRCTLHRHHVILLCKLVENSSEMGQQLLLSTVVAKLSPSSPLTLKFTSKSLAPGTKEIEYLSFRESGALCDDNLD
ncbi:hypothetical protein SELMODRAFT_406361 [Selaginella moellendorffii]|uniref:F-box domain-containing protein n=1 Tax=Selaginella moellendorffii TaxID=88036 RepID=D8R246_SELML|nr:hypothetical protein SELMODRAFT_406361 [Selaginella moellendorffii]